MEIHIRILVKLQIVIIIIKVNYRILYSRKVRKRCVRELKRVHMRNRSDHFEVAHVYETFAFATN